MASATVATLIARLELNSKEFDARMSNAERALKNLETQSKRSGGAVTQMSGMLRAAATGGAALYAAKLLSLGVQVEAWGRRYRTVFEGSTGVLDQWVKDSAQRFGMAEERLQGMTAAVGDLFVPMGFARDRAAEMSKEVLNLSGALSEWTGATVSAADASNAITRAILGEREALIPLGVKISELDVTTRLAAIGADKLTGEALAQAKAQVTLELITERSTDAIKAFSEGQTDAMKAQTDMKAALDAFQIAASDTVVAMAPLIQSMAALLGIVTDIPGALSGAVVGLGVFMAGAKLGLGAIIGGPEALAAGVLYASTQNTRQSEIIRREAYERSKIVGPRTRRPGADSDLRAARGMAVTQMRVDIAMADETFAAMRLGEQTARIVRAASLSASIRQAEDAFGASLAAGFSESLGKEGATFQTAIEDLVASASIQKHVGDMMNQMGVLGLGEFAEGLTGTPAEIEAALSTILSSTGNTLALARAMGDTHAVEMLNGMMQEQAFWAAHWAAGGATDGAAYYAAFMASVAGMGNLSSAQAQGQLFALRFGAPPSNHSGGMVPGPSGASVPIMAMAGERVIPAGISSGGGGNVTVYVAGNVLTERDLIEQIRRGLSDAGTRMAGTGIT